MCEWASVPYWWLAAWPCVRADCTSLSPLILLSTNLTHYFLADAPSLPLPFSSSWLLRAELLMAGAELNEKSEQSSEGVWLKTGVVQTCTKLPIRWTISDWQGSYRLFSLTMIIFDIKSVKVTLLFNPWFKEVSLLFLHPIFNFFFHVLCSWPKHLALSHVRCVTSAK